MDALNRMLLDRVQRFFPLVSKPYLALSEGIDATEEEVRRLIGLLKERKLVRQISAIFNTGALGYRSSLVAMAVPESKLDRATAAVNEYAGVSHNYLRPGSYNMWYTIAVPPGQKLEEVVQELSLAAGGWPTLILPALRKYKLAVVLDVLEEGEGEPAENPPDLPMVEATVNFEPTEENIRIVRCIQEDLPLVEKPFEVWAKELGMTEDALLQTMADWLDSGIMRRFAAVLDHRRVGFGANGMVVWNCPENRIEEYGHILSSHTEVSHCYYRPSYPEWPYNLYAMVHGRTMEECETIAKRLGKSISLEDYRILVSTSELKKIRLKLFWD